jgi:hypothetical protein
MTAGEDALDAAGLVGDARDDLVALGRFIVSREA